MRAITAVMATVGVLGMLAASAPARADEHDGGWRRHQWREHQWHAQRWREHHGHARAWHAYAPPVAYYAPRR